jgi:hypothetical protein
MKPPGIISGIDGDTYALADSEAEALDEAVGAYGDEVKGVRYCGWMAQVPYPEDYDSREEWEQSTDFTESWWEGCQEPVTDKQREHATRAWVVLFR